MLRLLALLFVFALPAVAQPAITSDDLAEIRAVINRQIEAFRRDDAQEAFKLVSPAVQETFGTPERFLDVVRTSYGAIVRPTAVEFLGLTTMGEDAVQRVKITDRSGSVWLAYYAMQRQRDGSWRTNGCHLVQPARSLST
ncbi:MAG: DUF4864 domain-containing protein [Betaproteobacteria bacterium]|nr:DUF4864 domain-containing protein [Betaproteobacteria bacterium]MBV9360526.1 DUF4864 domain-containing protein [Betaproteobacteria bacterium]